MKETNKPLADIGLIGLAVMGENLCMNIESKGYAVAVYNIDPQTTVTRFMQSRGQGKNITDCYSLEDLVANLKPPRKILMMIRAGKPIDDMIDALLPLLDKGDILIDGGNSAFSDSARRLHKSESHGILYVGMGVSGGEEGALKGPSLMPGGSPAAWPHLIDLLTAIAAKANGLPCCHWVGEGGAGHFVKMVHNGIEYGDMQLIAEACLIMRDCLNMTADEQAAVFRKWNTGKLSSYLIEITAAILAKKDEDGLPVIDTILDVAGQKGTGKWAVEAALDEGSPLTLIAEAVFARFLSADKDGRTLMAGLFPQDKVPLSTDREAVLNQLQDALYAAKIISYTQGFSLLKQAADTYGWQIDFGGIALLWQGGCIIRSTFLSRIREAFIQNPRLPNLLAAPYFTREIQGALNGWRQTCSLCTLQGLSAPAMQSALSYFDGLRTAASTANILQAQRDYFGAHTFEKTTHPRGEFFHINWTGEGGETASTTYNA